MSAARGWVLGGLLSLAAWTAIACGNDDQVVDRGVDISRDARPPDPQSGPKGQPDSAPVTPDAGVDSALPDRAAPDVAPDAAAPESGSDAPDLDGSVTINPTAGTISDNL